MLKQEKRISKWTGKRWRTIGDSITFRDQEGVARGYQTIVNEGVGFSEIINDAIPGASMALNANYPSNGSNVISSTADSIPYANDDLITIAAGTNDFKLNVPLGTKGQIDDTEFDDKTFYGAYRKLIEHILTENPTVKMYLFTPIQRDNSGYDVNFVNPAGHKLIDYVRAVQEIGSMYAIPVLDLYSVSGITKKNLAIYTTDGLHLNESGYERIADSIAGFIETF